MDVVLYVLRCSTGCVGTDWEMGAAENERCGVTLINFTADLVCFALERCSHKEGGMRATASLLFVDERSVPSASSSLSFTLFGLSSV